MRRVVRNLALLLPFTTLVTTAAQSPGLASASGVYNSSDTQSTLPWNTYNFCNAPHVNAAHYELPPQANAAGAGGAQLLHVSVVMRHHKVRPMLVCTKKTEADTHAAYARQPRAAGGHARSALGRSVGLRGRRAAHVRPGRHCDRARRDDTRAAAIRTHDMARDV